ncbi:hypothetical protein GC093_07475 [Paenibacillus sp. LMG 31456]|uniref:Glycosyltransferase RgtA/B/C/D-like domain-containing protein n=1 Tax=Paenibacillus foliorum TaxID=2654974 RepID=A0A972GRE8_9BACL|nr:glycosyltransferase family 39 protein [Paenibacillus foliorum]NOU93074.1 hypothetical protein [Paenibacillus foliorum]
MPRVNLTKKYTKMYLLLFILTFAAEFAFGYYLTCIRGYVAGDAISRVANAFYISHSRHPHLAAIGFVWNPLPSLIEWVWLWFWPIFPKLASNALAAVLTTSLFAAGTVVLLLQNLIRFGLPTPLSVLFCILYALNPFLFLYGANGMTEVMFTFFLVATVTSLSRWLEDEASRHIIMLSMALALAFLVRYEAIPLAAAAGCSMLIAIFFIPSKHISRADNKASFKYLRSEGSIIVALTPFVYTCLIWIFLNYMIMGNPFFFFNSNYSNLSFSEALSGNDQFSRMIGNPVNIISYVAFKSSFFSVPLLIIVLFRLVTRKLLQWDMLIFIGILLSIPALQSVMLYKGTSYGWLRFFFYIFPIMAAWLPYEIVRLKLNAKFVLSVHLIGLVVTGALVAYAMSDPSRASEEYDTFNYGKNYNEQQIAKQIAQYINDELPDDLILLDSFTDFQVIVNTNKPSNLVITSDLDFLKILANPAEFQVSYILVPPPIEGGLINAINKQYPSLYEHGGHWVTLEKQFEDYRKLYKVIGAVDSGMQQP